MPNEISGLQAFIEAWDAKPRHPTSSAAKGSTENVGPDGEINVDGSATCTTAVIFVPSHPRFVSALEPGVRDLCLALIDALDCITYSSCQGHRAAEPGSRYRRRHVGIVPRDEAEERRLETALERVCRETNAGLPETVVRVCLVVDKVAGDLGERTCLDLAFYGEGVNEDQYFREADLLTSRFIAKLQAFSAE